MRGHSTAPLTEADYLGLPPRYRGVRHSSPTFLERAVAFKSRQRTDPATCVGGQSALPFPIKTLYASWRSLIALALSYRSWRFSHLKGAKFMHQPSQALLRKYAIDRSGTIHFIESVLAPGQFLASRLTHTGAPLDSRIVTFKELKGMTLHSELRTSRALAAVNFHRYGGLNER
jgi:hypothetical protein